MGYTNTQRIWNRKPSRKTPAFHEWCSSWGSGFVEDDEKGYGDYVMTVYGILICQKNIYRWCSRTIQFRKKRRASVGNSAQEFWIGNEVVLNLIHPQSSGESRDKSEEHQKFQDDRIKLSLSTILHFYSIVTSIHPRMRLEQELQERLQLLQRHILFLVHRLRSLWLTLKEPALLCIHHRLSPVVMTTQ